MVRSVAVALFCLAQSWIFAQARLDAHTIMLFDLEGSGNALTIQQPRVLTGFNPKGYNNQPMFFGDTELWLTTQTREDTTQTDIVMLDLAQKRLTQITKTRLSEYSPTPMPNGADWSAIVVEADGTQRLWQFPRVGGGNGKPLLTEIKNVGYHCWLNDKDLALFIVGTPHTLVRTDTKTQKRKLIANNIGRCLIRHPVNGKLLFVFKATEATWYIKSYDPTNDKQEIICQTLPNSEDFTVLPNGQLVMGQGSKLYQRQGDLWAPFADLSPYGVQKITRLAMRGTVLAVVTN